MKLGIFALAVFVLLLNSATRAQNPGAGTITDTATENLAMLHRLDNVVKRIQKEGWKVSRIHRDLNPDGTPKHYSFEANRAVKNRKDNSHDSGHISVNLNFVLKTAKVS